MAASSSGDMSASNIDPMGMDLDDERTTRPGDALLAATATSPFDARPPTAAEDDPEKQLWTLVARLGNLGIDITRADRQGWCPDPQSLDYRTNHCGLLDHFGLHLTRKTQDSDILARYRLAVRICHPDKLPPGSSKFLIDKAAEFFIKLTTAKDELLQRADWVRRRQIEPQRLEQALVEGIYVSCDV